MQALGLGEIRVQSALSQGFKGNIPILGDQLEDLLPSCIKARMLTFDGALLSVLDISLNTSARAPLLQLSSVQRINEPAVMVAVEILCNTTISRTYQILLDPPEAVINLPTVAGNSALNPAINPIINPIINPAGQVLDDPASRGVTPSANQNRPRSKRKRSRRTEPVLDEVVLPPRTVSGKKRNVLRVAKQSEVLPDLGGNTISPTEAAEELKLLLSRRLSNDNSPLASAEVSTFSETLRKEQNNSVLREVERAELRTLKKQIEVLEGELKRTRQTTPPVSAPGTIATAVQSVLPMMPAMPAMSSGMGQRAYHWVIGLAAMLVVCLVAIAWLLWRLAGLRSKQPVFGGSTIMGVPENTPSQFVPNPPPAAAVPKAPPKPQSQPQSQSISRVEAKSSPQQEKGIEFVFDEKVLPPQLFKPQASTPQAKSLAKAPPKSQLKPLSNDLSSEILFPSELNTGTGSGVPQVEEFSDVMHEAEFWISLNKPLNAIQVLQTYTAQETIRSPLPWLLLFDLYLKVGEQDEFAVLQRQFQGIFNAKIPDWQDYKDAQRNHGLEQMEYLMGRVETLWLTDEILPFLESLLIDDRDGTREGFELGTYQDILLLINIAKELQAQDAN